MRSLCAKIITTRNMIVYKCGNHHIKSKTLAQQNLSRNIHWSAIVTALYTHQHTHNYIYHNIKYYCIHAFWIVYNTISLCVGVRRERVLCRTDEKDEKKKKTCVYLYLSNIVYTEQ